MRQVDQRRGPVGGARCQPVEPGGRGDRSRRRGPAILRPVALLGTDRVDVERGDALRVVRDAAAGRGDMRRDRLSERPILVARDHGRSGVGLAPVDCKARHDSLSLDDQPRDLCPDNLVRAGEHDDAVGDAEPLDALHQRAALGDVDPELGGIVLRQHETIDHAVRYEIEHPLGDRVVARPIGAIIIDHFGRDFAL